MLSWDGKLWGEKKPYTTTDIQPSIRPQRPTIAQYGERIQLPEEKLEVEQFNRAKADALKDANIRTTNQGTFEELKQLFIELQNNQNTTGIQGQDNQVPTLARFLDKYRDIAGQRINQNEQQDVKIFLMNLFDHLEIHLDCLNMHNFIRRYFRCFLSEQQICVNGHLVNNAQRSKIITVQKSGVSNLYEALGGMIRGVYAKDAICSECQKENKGNNILIKRTLLQTLPNTIIFNIARVDFDVKQGRAVKDKSKFTFPYGLNQKQRDGQRGRYLTEEDQLDDILDLTPFTREAVLKNEASVNSNQERYQLIKKKINNYRKDKDKESDIRNYPVKSTSYDNMGRGEQYYKFRLVGVVIHQGNAAGGHYYSYVRERNPPYRWIKFNDNKTHYVLFRNEQSEQSSSSLSNQDQYVQGSIPIFNNQYNLMEEEFFGGQIQQSNLDADLFGVQQYNQEFRREMMERQNSACLIIYERIQPIDDWAFELGLVPQNAQQQQTPQIQYPRNLQGIFNFSNLVEINQQPDPVIVRAQQQMLENQVQVQPKPKSPESQIYNQNQYLQSIPKPQSKSPASSPSIQSTSLSQSNSKGKIQMPPPPQPKNINQDIEQVMVYANHLLGKLDRGEIFVQKHIDWIFKFYPDKLPEYNQNNQRDQPIFLRELLNTIIHQTKSIEQIQKVSAKIPGIQVPSAGNPPPIQGSIQKGIPTPLSGASKAASNFDIQNKLLIQGKSSPAPPVQQAQQLPTKSKTEVIKIESIQAQPKKDNPANVAYQQGNAKKP
ncbi:MAG: putative Ubiquitin carboxyl-terminal hydrolase [Streblomastix strix]|uniref:Putative Ubiquitin carboxyl-terminal hydrolase n=1 Tax=Streblomastix strix TaxID=222440 RepID=A0A5J4WG07_9EUKA|nr:MAG: putative Ubiquitin carboxyl-terminal hydrolase [Streblomastix strix]